MIVRETDQHFVMTTQHEHARFAGEIANYFVKSLFLDEKYIRDVLFAIQEHDRGWIRLDDTPIWNDRHSVPFSFADYPLLPKLALYRIGIDEVEKINDYAALLCSIHYSSFTHLQSSKLTDCVNFINNEIERQTRLKAKLGQPTEDMISNHYKLLQLCDDISLYVCINNPGATKDIEHPWFKEGFDTIINDQRINAHWINNKEIVISPFLFERDFTTTIKSKQVPKELIGRLGINDAYKETNWTEQEVIFRVNS